MTPHFANYTSTLICVNYYRSLPPEEAIKKLKRLHPRDRVALGQLLSRQPMDNTRFLRLMQALGQAQTPRENGLLSKTKIKLAHGSAKRLYTLLNHFPLLSDTRFSYLPKEILYTILAKISPDSCIQLPMCMQAIEFLNPNHVSFLPNNSALIEWVSRKGYSLDQLKALLMHEEWRVEVYKKSSHCHMVSVVNNTSPEELHHIIDLHQSLTSLTVNPHLLELFLSKTKIEAITLKYGLISTMTIEYLRSFKALKRLNIRSCQGYTDDIEQKLKALNLESLGIHYFIR